MRPKGHPAFGPNFGRTQHRLDQHRLGQPGPSFLPRTGNRCPAPALTFGFHMKDHIMTLRSKPRLAKPLILLPLLALLGTAGCETFKGAGRDISGAGRTVTSGAIEVQNDL